MNIDDIDFISRTETCRTLSNIFIIAAIVLVITSLLNWTSSVFEWVPSAQISGVLAILAVAFRLIAIDRFLRMSRQQDQ